MNIRPERPSDKDAIFALTQSAFSTQPFSSGTEGPIINALREDGHLTLSLVAEEAGHLIGHIAFSPVSIAGESEALYALGPVSAHPDRQKEGIGSALIHAGLSRLAAAKAIVLIGDPNYYHRFGFIGNCGLTYHDVPPAFVQILNRDDRQRQGEIIYSQAFNQA